MATTLPGQNVTTNVPPLPNVKPDVTRPVVPMEWDDINRATLAVFDYLKRYGKPAADKLIAWLNKERNS